LTFAFRKMVTSLLKDLARLQLAKGMDSLLSTTLAGLVGSPSWGNGAGGFGELNNMHGQMGGWTQSDPIGALMMTNGLCST
jgi:hypothetical protein